MAFTHRCRGSRTHSRGEYVSEQDATIHTNSVEGYFSILKRGIFGTVHHVSEAHLGQYLNEFDFRYNTRAGLSEQWQKNPSPRLS
jgi:hypothetical protein